MPLPIDNPNAGSVRLFFARESALSRLFHICDAALGRGMPDGKVMYLAFHGDWLYPEERYDTVLAARIATRATDVFCERCLEEYRLAKEIIDEKRLLKFR